jgi:HEPN domain-containing protein
MTAPERDPLEWLLRAENDLLNIRNNLNSSQIPWDTLVFHAQQACEKLLKAIIIKSGQLAPRTHDLILLLNMCPAMATKDPSLQPDLDKLMLLFGSRYPDTKQPTEAEARNAAGIAEKVARLARPIIKPAP